MIEQMLDETAAFFRLSKDPINQIFDVRHMPAPVSRGANAACIESGGNAAQIGDPGCADGNYHGSVFAANSEALSDCALRPRAVASQMLFCGVFLFVLWFSHQSRGLMSKKKLPLAQEGEAIVEYETCPRCRGTGRGYGIDDCGKCNGAGRIPLAK
jgi:hypothetical protein